MLGEDRVHRSPHLLEEAVKSQVCFGRQCVALLDEGSMPQEQVDG